MHQGRRSPPIFLDLSPRAGQGGDVRCVYKTFTLNTIGYLFNNDMRRATTLPSLRTYIARYLYLLPSIRRDRTSHVTRSPALARFRYKVLPCNARFHINKPVQPLMAVFSCLVG